MITMPAEAEVIDNTDYPDAMRSSTFSLNTLKEYRASTVEAELLFEFGSVRLVHDCFHEEVDVTSPVGGSHVVALTMLPVPGSAWGSFINQRGGRSPASFGETFLLPAGHIVRIKSECRHQSSVVCRFNPDVVDKWFEYGLDWTDCRLQAALDINSPRIKNLLWSISGEMRTPGFAGEAMIELMAGQVAIEISRYINKMIEEKEVGGLSPRLLKLIDEHIRESTRAPSVSELASLCEMSSRHLARTFYVSKGQSLGRYVSEHRIEKAKRLLATGKRVKSVAYSMGFSAPSNFSAAFRKATGETPREYQLKVRGH